MNIAAESLSPDAHAPTGESPVSVVVLTGSLSRHAGGVFEALVGLCQGLYRLSDVELNVLGLTDAGTEADAVLWRPIPVTAGAVRGPRPFGFSPALGPALARIGPDIVHVHGLWMYPSVVALRWCARAHGSCVVSPHGMLDPWALRNSAWKKRIAGALYEARHLRGAACLHAVGEAEHDAIRAFGLRNPICVIPNGVSPPQRVSNVAAWRSELSPDSPVLLYLGRLHPKKGLATLLRAWGAVQESVPGSEPWRLVIAGWDQGGHRAELEALARSTGVSGSVHFVGPQFGADKDATFAAADAFVLPSVSEGLPIAVLEAWSHGLPVLMTPQCNLREGYAAGAALQFDNDRDSIAFQLRRLILMAREERHAMGRAGYNLVVDHFAWPELAAQMRLVYRWLLRREPQPDCVRLSDQQERSGRQPSRKSTPRAGSTA